MGEQILEETAWLSDTRRLNWLPKFDAIVFDFDGTLVDESKVFEKALLAACEALGIKPPNRRRRKFLAKQHPDTYLKHLLSPEALNRSETVQRFMEAFTEAYDLDRHRHANLNRHAKPLLRALKIAGLKVGLVTRRTTLWRAVPEILHLFSISQMIDKVVTYREAETKPEQLKLCLSSLGVKPSASTIVGDTAEDIFAGRALGCLTIAYTKGFGTLSDLLKAEPDYLIADLMDILHILASERKA
jgi:phosphoglycolate phosphatase-like HAD superfamily hydrolase